MKAVPLLLAALGVLKLACMSGHSGKEHQIIKVEFNYLPWSVNRESTITEFELLDLEDPLVSTYCSTEKDIISQLMKLFNPNNLNVEPSIQAIEPYMVVSFYFDNGEKNKMLIGQSMLLQINGVVYSMRGEQRKWLRETIPQATIPNGIRIKCE